MDLAALLANWSPSPLQMESHLQLFQQDGLLLYLSFSRDLHSNPFSDSKPKEESGEHKVSKRP